MEKSSRLAVDVVRELEGCRNYGLVDQLMRSSLSVPSNISEGEERETAKESARFLYYAKGSCAELLTQSLLAQEFGYLPKDEVSRLTLELEEISKMLAGYINYLNRDRTSI